MELTCGKQIDTGMLQLKHFSYTEMPQDLVASTANNALWRA